MICIEAKTNQDKSDILYWCIDNCEASKEQCDPSISRLLVKNYCDHFLNIVVFQLFGKFKVAQVSQNKGSTTTFTKHTCKC